MLFGPRFRFLFTNSLPLDLILHFTRINHSTSDTINPCASKTRDFSDVLFHPKFTVFFLFQKYVDDICGEGCQRSVAGEDSSYDSDYEADPVPNRHQDVSRTASDTLAAEYAEYVETTPDASPGYTARVEFALKLGYTEKLVQAALQKLGPSPAQNELLAELIKLGAQKGGSCDSSPSESTLDVTDVQGEQVGGQALRPIVIDGSNVAMR